MVLSKLRSLSFIMALLITMSMLGIFAVPKALAAAEETVPGYRMVNVYDAENGVVTSKIYVTGGKALVGILGIAYNTELVSLAATTSDGKLTTEYEELVAKGNIAAFISKGSGVIVLDGRNHLDDLINEEKGEFFFEWYYGMGGALLDACEEDVGLAVVRFKVNDGVTKEELESCGADLIAFAREKPSSPNVKGYSSGAYITNENNAAVRNNGKSKYSLTIYIEYEGLDIAGGFDVTRWEANNVRLVNRNMATRIIIIPMGVKPGDIDLILTPTTEMSIDIHDKEDNLVSDIITTGCYAKLTRGNLTEKIIIAVENDIDCDGKATMADLNTLMRILSGNITNVSEPVKYAYDTDADGQLSKNEYNNLVSSILDNITKE